MERRKARHRCRAGIRQVQLEARHHDVNYAAPMRVSPNLTSMYTQNAVV